MSDEINERVDITAEDVLKACENEVAETDEPTTYSDEGVCDTTATQEGESHIKIRDLSKIYVRDEKETVAIENFSLDIKKGELVSIVGPSGCGKTTVLRMIALMRSYIIPRSGRK